MRAQELSVRLYDHEVGTLVPTRRGARFSYTDDMVEAHLGQPVLSLSLPVKRRPYAEGLTGSWFRGLLPEGERLTGICRSIGCSESDYLSILAHIGWECAGAVSICPADFTPPQLVDAHTLSDSELADKLRDLPTYGGIDPTAHVSLGGYQEKLLVVASDVHEADGYVTQAHWVEPDAAMISTHIIKPQPAYRYPHIIEAEAWAMHAARHAARCSNTALLRLDGAPLSLIIERFDRKCANGTYQRVHQEDCCQAMGLDPSGKYAGVDMPRGSDPTFLRIARLLNQYSADPYVEQCEVLKQMVVNLVMGNTDAHAKNYALIYHAWAVPSVAPLYDVVPVVDIEPRATHLSMRIAGKIELEAVHREDVIVEARSWGLSTDTVIRTLDETLEQLVAGIKSASGLYPEAGVRHQEGALRRAEQLMKR